MRPTLRTCSRSAVLALAVSVSSSFSLAGCTASRQLTVPKGAEHVLSRLDLRAQMVESAVYRVRWRAIGTAPHAEFFLDIAYKAPGRFRIVANGPFDAPAFTAVVIGDDFWFVDHHEGRYVTDRVVNLANYDVPMAEFFSSAWRDLFSGGWGGGESVGELTPSKRRHEYLASTVYADWIIRWNEHREAPSTVEAADPADPRHVLAEVWFDRSSSGFPFWQLKQLHVRGEAAGGEHRWSIIRQAYNRSLPDDMFAPLPRPRE
jgi:hypothetical protein